jgi:serine/threonine-protein kinase
MPSSLFGYDVIDFIGEGAGSVIYVVSEPASRQIYALKHVVRRKEKDVRFLEQLENEHAVGQQVVHPNLRRIFDMKNNKTLLRRPTEAALLMELFDGRSLEMVVPRKMTALLDVFIQTARALQALHEAGFVHCDLKPANILIGARSEVKVIDLGQACKAGTAKARIQGTPDFIAPEQVRCEAVSRRTDIFNFGATLYWALCGQKLPTLFTLKNSQNSFLVDDQIAAPATLNPTVPQTLSNFVMECVRTNPARRPADMLEVARRLDVLHHSLTRRAAAAPAEPLSA